MPIQLCRTYWYSPLDGDRTIRLLTLSPGNHNEPISLTITHASLDQQPIYEALSYVWGPPLPSYPVRCNDGFLGVGQNLKDALQHLRKPDEPRVLWIDRIAVNQEDMDERGQQVGLMADIYNSASLVVVWLGTEDASTKPAFEVINDLNLQFLQFQRAQNAENYAQAETMGHPIQYLPANDPEWTAVESLLQNQWFARVLTTLQWRF